MSRLRRSTPPAAAPNDGSQPATSGRSGTSLLRSTEGMSKRGGTESPTTLRASGSPRPGAARPRSDVLGAIAKTLLLAAIYYASARLGLKLQFEQTQATPVWPPSGIAFAALLLFGPRIGGGVFLGAFLANLVDFYVKSKTPLPFSGANLLRHIADHPEHVAVSAMIGVGNMLEAVVGCHLVRRSLSRSELFHDIPSVLLFVAAAFLCCMIASTVGASSFFADSLVPRSLLSTMWFTWWLGDATGILILTPLILVWSQLRPQLAAVGHCSRMAAALLLLFLFSEFIFNGWLEPELSSFSRLIFDGWLDLAVFRQAYIVIPILLLTEFAFGNVLATLGVAIVSTIAILATVQGRGPFAALSQNEALLVLQGFAAIVSVTMLLLDAALRERGRALRELSHARDQLELRVTERTAQLREANEELSAQIRERARAQEMLRHAQKMEAIGQLTGGIAHDFNNRLQVVLGNLDALRRRFQVDGLGADPDFRRMTEAAICGAERGAALTQQLLGFARRQPLEPKATDVSRLVRSMSDLLLRTLGETISIKPLLADGLWRVFVDPNQLENALLNLAVNARDAMPAGGTLTIETANAYLDEAYAAQHQEVAPGKYVVIAVTDTGKGMPKDVLAKAFEPFFTTKEVGKGSGLGLSQVYGFVKQSGGHAKLYSEHGQGTTAKLYLPRAVPTEGALDAAAPEPLAPAGRDQTILVVEDDEDVRAFVVDTLRELGYSVLEASDGSTALRLLGAHTEVRLLLTDLGLPDGMNGHRLADEARRQLPDLKVLFTTGYGRNDIINQARLDPGLELIVKPFSYAALSAKIRQMLATDPSAAG